MLSTVQSLRQILAFECPVCGHILTQSEWEDEYYYCEQCGYCLHGSQVEEEKNPSKAQRPSY